MQLLALPLRGAKAARNRSFADDEARIVGTVRPIELATPQQARRLSPLACFDAREDCITKSNRLQLYLNVLRRWICFNVEGIFDRECVGGQVRFAAPQFCDPIGGTDGPASDA